MKRILTLTILLIAVMCGVSVDAYAHGWSPQASGTTNVLHGVHFVGDNNGWAVSNKGEILHTTNGGILWSMQTSGVSNSLSSVFFTGANDGYVVGNSGTILRTTNGGTTWTSQSVGATFFKDVSFSDASHGLVVGDGGVVLKTTNGGASWTTLPALVGHLEGVSYINASTATIVGSGGVIYRTTNGGTSWTSQSSGTSNALNATSFFDVNNGFAVGTGGTILRTTDGGTTWASQNSSANHELHAVFMATANRCYAVGHDEEILSTTNGGATWTSQSSEDFEDLFDVFFSSPTTGTIVGAHGAILRTTTGGVNCGSTVITISPSTLPAGTVGIAYSQTITASGGTAPFTFAVTSGALPPGLAVSALGVLSGSPTSSGGFSFTVTATDDNHCQRNRSYSVTITCLPIGVNPATLPNGTVGTPYSQTIIGSAGLSPYSFTVTSGSLPAGLSLSAGGLLSGTPTTSGTSTFIVTATDSRGCTGSRSYTLTMDCPAIAVNPATLPNGTLGASYNETISASGGMAPYSFTVSSGALPTGLTLSPGGVLSGTPTVAGSFTFTLRATDAQGCKGTRNYTVIINCPSITLSPALLPAGAVNTPYSQTITASGGTAPYSFSVTSGILPNGLTLSSGGVLSGSPTSGGTFSFTVTATDLQGCTGTRTYSLVIDCPTITLDPATLPAGTAGTSYSQTLTASGGTPPHSFALTSGALPAGLTLSSSGVISGTPLTVSSATCTITATDAHGCAGSSTYTLVITCPTMVISALPNGTVGSPYSESLTASGGTAPYTFSPILGTLPSGLTLSGSGILSGTPDAAGSYTFTLLATDAHGCTGSRSFTLTMSCASITVLPASLPNGSVGISYLETISASGGTSPYTFGITAGALPDGLTLSASGSLSGTPTADGIFSFTVTATDANGCKESRPYSITIGGCLTITLSPTTLPSGNVGSSYSQTITASGGTAPYTFAQTSGTLPTGLTLSGSGVLDGTPSAANTFTFSVTATDNFGCTGTLTYTVTICATITLSPLPAGTLGTPYSQTITASGGTAPYAFIISSGALSPGLALSSSGVLSGSPTQLGSSIFTVRATDAQGCTGEHAYSLSIDCPSIVVTPSALPHGTSGVLYSQTILASAGTAPVVFAVMSGSLPGGLSLSSSGLLSGTPTQSGTFNFTVRATDADGCMGTQIYALIIDCPAIELNPSTLPNGTFGVAYNQTIAASGGKAPHIFTVTSGTIPPGLTLSASGVLSGSPTGGGDFTFEVTATDANGCQGRQSYAVRINVTPGFLVAPSSIGFGNVLVGTSKEDSVTVRNPGSGTLTVFSASSTSGNFNVTPNSATVPPGMSLKFYITFEPAGGGSKLGDIVFSHNAAGSPDNVGVNGTGVLPQFAILTNLVFGNVFLGSTKDDSVTVSNAGTSPLMISSVTSDNGEFSVTPNSATLAPGDNITFYVTFHPTTLGGKTGKIVMIHNAVGSPSLVPVRGTGVVTVSVTKLKDTDGDPNTTADQTPKEWYLALYRNSVAPGNLVAEDPTGELTVLVSQAGTYIALEADSSLPWMRINGNQSGYDTFIVTTTDVATAFINFKANAITIRKFQDGDGNFWTIGDRTPLSWHLEIRKDSVNGTLVASGNGSSLTALTPGDGTYFAVETDSSEWVHLGYVLNGLPVESDVNAVSFTVLNGQSVMVDFVNAASIYHKYFRSMSPQDLSEKTARKKKFGAMRFCVQFVNNTGTRMNGLRMEIRLSDVRGVVFTIVDRGPFTTATSFDSRIWEFGGATIEDGETVTICGIENTGRNVKIRNWSWLLNGVAQAPQLSFLPFSQFGLYKMPNFANLRNDVYLQGGFVPTNGMVVGIERSDSPKKYGWVRIRRSNGLQRSLIDRTGYHTMSGHGFDTFVGGKPFVREQRQPVAPRRYNNLLFAEQIALRFGIVASAMGKIPEGLGELIYDEGPSNPLSGLTLVKIAARIDSALTFWRDTATHGWHYVNFDTTLTKINRAFDGPVDTLTYASNLVFKGVKRLVDVPFLHPNLTAVPARILPSPFVNSETPEQFQLYNNYPNPFNPTTTIEFDLPAPAFVTLNVYNILGQKVATLLDHEEFDEGNYNADWDATSFASGVYFFRIVADGTYDEENETTGPSFVSTKKMLLLK